MRNIFTKTSDNNKLNEFPEKREIMNLEPDREVLMLISQFAKVYHVDKQMKRNGFYIPLILN